jgi:hypothetical protein
MTDATERRHGATSESAKRGWDTRRRNNVSTANMGRPVGKMGSAIAKAMSAQSDRPISDILQSTYHRCQSQRQAAKALGVDVVTFRSMSDEQGLRHVSVLVTKATADAIESGGVIQMIAVQAAPT